MPDILATIDSIDWGQIADLYQQRGWKWAKNLKDIEDLSYPTEGDLKRKAIKLAGQFEGRPISSGNILITTEGVFIGPVESWIVDTRTLMLL